MHHFLMDSLYENKTIYKINGCLQHWQVHFINFQGWIQDNQSGVF